MDLQQVPRLPDLSNGRVEFFRRVRMVVFLVVSGWGTSITEMVNGLGISHTDSANALHAG